MLTLIAPISFIPHSNVLPYGQNHVKCISSEESVTIHLDRFSSSDLFNLKIYSPFEYDSTKEDLRFLYSLNLSNKVFLDGNQNTNPFYKMMQLSQDNNNINANHILMEDLKFEDLNLLGFSIDHYSHLTPILRSSLFIEKPSYTQEAIIDSNESIELEYLSGFTFTALPKERTSSNFINNNTTNIKINSYVDSEKSKIIVEPIQLNRFGSNREIANVYLETNKDPKDAYFDIRFGEGKMSVPGINKDINIKLERINVNDVQLETVNGYEINGPIKRYNVGKIVVTDQMYYDYESQNIKIGPNPFFGKGLIVPFDFKGDYIRTIKMDLNSSFNDVKISFVDHFNQRLLDKYDGIISLHVMDYQEIYEGKYNILDSDDIEKIRKSSEDISLIGLRRLSNE